MYGFGDGVRGGDTGWGVRMRYSGGDKYFLASTNSNLCICGCEAERCTGGNGFLLYFC